MVSLYLDHNVSLRIVASLQWAGHDVRTARDESLTRRPDDVQLLSAVRSGRVLITHNRGDFALLHDAWLAWPAAFGIAFPPHAGILVLDAAAPQVLSSVAEAFLETAPPPEIINHMFWWHHREGWRRRLLGDEWEPYPQGPR